MKTLAVTTLVIPPTPATDLALNSARKGAPPARRHLGHLSGLRALACAWVVTSHFSERPRGMLGNVLDRGFVPVNLFIVMSGFVTHYASADKPLARPRELLAFHAQRIGRILPLHWLMLALQLPTSSVTPQGLLGSVLLATSWNCYEDEPTPRCADWPPVNILHWTLSTLLFAWLMYPVLRPLVRAADRGVHERLVLSGVLLVITMLPALSVRLAAGELSRSAWGLLYKWPPLRLPDFVFGMSVGQLAHDERVLGWSGWPWLVDAAAATLVVGLLLLPRPDLPACPEHRCGHEVFLISGCNVFFGVLLLGGCATRAERSAVARLASMRWLSDVGQYSFHIYLLQDWMAKVFLLLQNFSAGSCSSWHTCWGIVGPGMYHAGPGGAIASSWWMLFCAALVGVSSAWYTHVEQPWVQWMRRRLVSGASVETRRSLV